MGLEGVGEPGKRMISGMTFEEGAVGFDVLS